MTRLRPAVEEYAEPGHEPDDREERPDQVGVPENCEEHDAAFVPRRVSPREFEEAIDLRVAGARAGGHRTMLTALKS
jgi:hypothetical protein